MDLEFPALHLKPRFPRAGRNNVVRAATSAGLLAPSFGVGRAIL